MFIIDNLKEANLFLEKIDLGPKIEIVKVNEYFQKRCKERKIQNKKGRNKFKISKQKECDVEIIQIPSISINKQENIEIKSKYNKTKKKTDYKRLRQSKRNTYQYQGIKIKPNKIEISKETRFIFKGKEKKPLKKIKNIIKQEIIYFYNSPIIEQKEELSIGGNIQNIINATKKEPEEKKYKTITNENSIHNQSEHIIGVSPEKEEKGKEYSSNTYPIILKKNEKTENIQILDKEKDNEKEKENQEEFMNKNDSIRISQIRGDKKYFSKKYISPRRMKQNHEGQTDESKKNEENRVSLNSVNDFNLTKDEKTENNNSKINNNVFYSSSFDIGKKKKIKN